MVEETGRVEMVETQIVAPSNSTFRPTSDSRTHRLHLMYHGRVNVDIAWIHH